METHTQQTIHWDDFIKVDIRSGTILTATPNPKAIKPSYVLQIDFGETLGIKTSSAQLTENYQPENLIGKQICAVVNFPPRRIAGVKSDVLVLGIVCKDNGIVLVSPTQAVVNGERLA